MRVTSKDQVTIPKVVRDAAGVGPGSDIGFEARNGGRARCEGWVSGLATDETIQATRGPFEDLDAP